MLTDGAPEPEATFYPLYNVSQVEVMKGPTAILYGGNSAGRRGAAGAQQPQARRFADVSLSYGEFDTFEGMLDANAASADGKLSFRLNGLYTDTQQYRDDKDGLAARGEPGAHVAARRGHARWA